MAGKRQKPQYGEGSYTTRKDGTVSYRVRVGPANRRVTKHFYGATREEALDKYRVWLAAHPHGPPTLNQQQPLNAILQTWLLTTIKPPSGAPSTYRNYFRLIRDHIASRIGQTPICELNLYAINAFLIERFETTGHGRTVEMLRNIIRAALEYAVRGGTITSNPAQYAAVPSFPRRKAKALTLVQARALIDAAAGRIDVRPPYKTKRTAAGSPGRKFPAIRTRLLPLYLLAITTGLRKGELLGLQWGDLEGNRLTISRSVDLHGVLQPRTKTAASAATIVLDDLLVAALETHRRALHAEDHEEGAKPDGLMFPTSAGRVMSQRDLDRHFKSVLAAAGLPNIRFHDLRHTAGSIMLETGSSLANVSLALRHANPAVTAKIYAHGNEAGVGAAISGVIRRLQGTE